MLGCKYIDDWYFGFCAQVHRVKDPSGLTLSKLLYGRPQSAGEDFCVEGAGDALIIFWSGAVWYLLDVADGVVDQCCVGSSDPCIQALCDSCPDVFGFPNGGVFLQDDLDKDQGTFGVPLAKLDALQLVREHCHEPKTHFAVGSIVVGRGKVS